MANSAFLALLLAIALCPGCLPGVLSRNLATPHVASTQCGTTKSSKTASITKSGGKRVMTSNGCPGYNWYVSKTTTLNNPTVQSQSFKFPLSPKISTATITVGVGSCKLGPIGVALNGVAFFSACDALGRDALTYEGASFDQCGGHATPSGLYHYHVVPGVSNPMSISTSRNNNFKYCSDTFWKETAGQHSPLIGFLADGIPIYGPQSDGGAVPTNLDACNGHVDASEGFYHYHATSNTPYLVQCLKGCVSSTDWNRIGTTSCSQASTQYDYSSLDNVVAA